MTTDAELEQLFTEHGIPRRILYPLWYRINRKLGLRHKPPVLLNLAEFYLYTIPGTVLIIATGVLIYQWLAGKPYSNLTPLFVAYLLVSLIGWFRYWNIRRRIGLAGKGKSRD